MKDLPATIIGKVVIGLAETALLIGAGRLIYIWGYHNGERKAGTSK